MLSQHPEQLNHQQAGPLVSPAADEIVILSEFPQRRRCCLTAQEHNKCPGSEVS